MTRPPRARTCLLFCGLRSREVLSLKLQDVSFPEEGIRVWGKGDKDRVLPMAPYVRRALVVERLFLGRGALSCEDAADANSDGRLDVSDSIATPALDVNE